MGSKYAKGIAMKDDRQSSSSEHSGAAADTAARLAAATNPLGGAAMAAPTREPSTQPTGPCDTDDDYDRWREAHIRQLDEDYKLWRQGGSKNFPADFETWRLARQGDLQEQRSGAGMPLMEATENAPESEKSQLLFERS